MKKVPSLMDKVKIAIMKNPALLIAVQNVVNEHEDDDNQFASSRLSYDLGERFESQKTLML